MPPKRFVAASDRVARVTLRRRLGTLAKNRVANFTVQRYWIAAVGFFVALHHYWGAPLAENYIDLDRQICYYIEHLWHEGDSVNLACDVISGIQHFLLTRRSFPGAWSLVHAWRRVELPHRAPPILPDILLAFAGVAIAVNRHDYAILLLVGFHCMLRTAEMLGITSACVNIGAACTGVIALPWTKTGQRQGAQQMATVDDSFVGGLLARFVAQFHEPTTLLRDANPMGFRRFFEYASQILELQELQLRPYSIRRGGATFDFLAHGNLQRTIFRARWTDSSVARIYVQDGVAVQAQMALMANQRALVHHYRELLVQSSQ